MMKTPNKTEELKPVSSQSQASLTYQSLMVHLRELRKVLIVSGAAVGIAFLALFFTCSSQLVAYLTIPLKDRGIQVVYTALAESFAIQAKVSFIAGVVLVSPIILWQVWGFVKPALYPSERAFFSRLFGLAIALFLVGVVFGYFVVFNMAVRFFLVSGENLATPMITLEKYVEFLFSFILPFGVVFELPIAIAMLSKIGIVSTSLLVRIRRYVIFIIFVLSAFLTPPVVISQVMLGIPLVILYEVGIIISRFYNKKTVQELEQSKKN